MDADVYDVIGVKSGCPTGKDPTGSCKNIAAVCYTLEESVILANYLNS